MSNMAAERVQDLLHQHSAAGSSVGRKTLIVDSLLEELVRFPHLTLQLFRVGNDNDDDAEGATVLDYLLKANDTDVYSIKSVCEISTNLRLLLTTWNAAGDLPIHVACKFASATIIQYMIEISTRAQPNVLQQHNQHSWLPIHCVMSNGRHGIPLSLQQRLLQHHPERIGWNRTLSMALSTGQPVELLDALVEQFPSDLHTLRIKVEKDAVKRAMGFDHAISFTKLFSKLTTLALDCQAGSDCDAIVYILRALQSNNTITKLEEMVVPCLSNEEDQHLVSVLRELELLIQQNTRLRDIVLSTNKVGDSKTWSLWIQALENGINRHNGTALEYLKVVVSDPEGRAVLQVQRNAKGFVNKLLLFEGSGALIRACLPDVPASLDSLYVVQKGGKDMSSCTSGVITRYLNTRATKLQTLVIEMADVDVSAVFEALRGETKLESLTVLSAGDDAKLQKWTSACLDLVKAHNTTLTKIYPWSTWDSRIEYYLELNRCGRTKVRHATSSGDVFRVLVPVMTYVNPNLAADFVAREHQQLGMMYGLLRESPATWWGIHCTLDSTGCCETTRRFSLLQFFGMIVKGLSSLK